MHRLLLPVLAAVALVLGLAAPAAGAATATDYVALGDSYSAGLGTRDYDPASGSCQRSPEAYPPLWTNQHTTSSFRFAACSGAVTSDVVANQVSALDAGTDLVSITIGGNDAGFSSTLQTCSVGTQAQCFAAVDAGEAFVRNQLPARLDTTYDAIRSTAPGARVVVLGYPHLFELGPCLVMSLAKRTKINEGADVIAGVLAQRAAAHGFSFSDVRSRFSGHGVCAAFGSAWLNGPTLPVAASYHPNVTGQARGYLPALTAVTG